MKKLKNLTNFKQELVSTSTICGGVTEEEREKTHMDKNGHEGLYPDRERYEHE